MLIFVCCFACFFCACEALPVSERVAERARRHMYNYYLDDTNYEWCVGVVKKIDADCLLIQYGDTIDDLKWTGYFWDYSNGEDDLSLYFQIDDMIEFCTPGAFDRYMYEPLVSIKKGDKILLEFEEGKNNLLYWVETSYQR